MYRRDECSRADEQTAARESRQDELRDAGQKVDEQQLVDLHVVEPVEHLLGLCALVEQPFLARDRQRIGSLPELTPYAVCTKDGNRISSRSVKLM